MVTGVIATPCTALMDTQLALTAGLMVIEQVVVPTTPFESVTWMLNVPEAVGVPVTAPVEVFNVRPAGSVPTMEKVYGAVPPVTVIGPLLKATPTVPVVTAEQVTEIGAGLMVMVQAVPTAPSASVT